LHVSQKNNSQRHQPLLRQKHRLSFVNREQHHEKTGLARKNAHVGQSFVPFCVDKTYESRKKQFVALSRLLLLKRQSPGEHLLELREQYARKQAEHARLQAGARPLLQLHPVRTGVCQQNSVRSLEKLQSFVKLQGLGGFRLYNER
jgi:hypothetical protein